MFEYVAYGAILLMAACLFFLASSTLSLATFAWWNPENRKKTDYAEMQPSQVHSFSLIMPCREEEEGVMRATLGRLLGQTHPDVEVIISVGHDDLATVAIAERLAAEHPEWFFPYQYGNPSNPKSRTSRGSSTPLSRCAAMTSSASSTRSRSQRRICS